MRTRLLTIGLVLVVIAAVGLFIHRNRPATITGKNVQYTVIGSMQRRDRIVTIKTGPEGTVYSVSTKDGHTLYENLSASQLKAEDPLLHEFVERGIAGDARLREGRQLDIDGRAIGIR